jgi:hypothetical protein
MDSITDQRGFNAKAQRDAEGAKKIIKPQRILNWLRQPSAPGDEIDQNHDNSNDEQDVNEPAHRVTGHDTEQPENEKNYRKGV